MILPSPAASSASTRRCYFFPPPAASSSPLNIPIEHRAGDGCGPIPQQSFDGKRSAGDGAEERWTGCWLASLPFFPTRASQGNEGQTRDLEGRKLGPNCNANVQQQVEGSRRKRLQDSIALQQGFRA